MQLSDTRWLARANVLKVILEQWTEIEAYFTIVIQNEKNHMARIIHEMLKDKKLFLYMTIVFNVIIKVNIVSGLFQQDDTDIFKIYLELYTLLLQLLRLIIKPIFLDDLDQMNERNLTKISDILNNELSYIPVQIIDFGYDYRVAIQKLDIEHSELIIIKERSRDFILTLCKEVAHRIPSNIGLFDSVKYFSLDYCLKKNNRPKFEQLPLHLLDVNADKKLLDMQWHNLISIDWYISENTTSMSFWINLVQCHKNAGGVYTFKELSDFALTALSLPLSNAVVERVFSHMNIIKTKIRNKMQLPLLDALIRIKVHFLVKQLSIKDFIPSQIMHKKFNSSMYDQYSKTYKVTEYQQEQNEDDTFDISDMF